ncbi:AI-2E family transporter [Anaerococcus lactolyticus]|uniref:Membrane protein n=1 Tax=Anaerococcus lactolyticus S7-1-13 TaxID=1284686 RepID=A0A095X564_9FIRM|nr:AI-2E family transporter [Anaerococcus lactolyticus]KGF04796.1 membrane protein [Anaerococcus lactolyticus S7-1-13]
MKEIFEEKTRKYFIIGILLIGIFFGFFYLDRIGEILETTYKVFRPIVYGLVIAFIINLPMNFFHDEIFTKIFKDDKHEKLRRSFSLILSWIIFFAMVTIVLTVLIPELSRAVGVISENIPAFMNSLIDFINGSKLLTNVSKFIVTRLEEINIERISDSFTKILQDFFRPDSDFINKTGSIINSVSQGILSLSIGFVFSLYVSMNKTKLKNGAARLVFANLSEKTARQIVYVAKLSYDSFARFLETRILSCLALGVACFIGMWVLRLPSAGMISILMGAFDMIPYIGAFLATSIGIILIFTYSPGKALVFLIFILILQNVQQQLFYPLVIGKHQGLPPIWIFVSVIIGGGLFGIFGMIAFIPLATVLYTLLEDNTTKKLKEKSISDEEIEKLTNKSFIELREERIENYQ